MARYSFLGSIPPKFEHKLRRHKQIFGKMATTVVLDKEDNLLWSGLQWHRSCHSNEMTLLPILLAAVYLGTGKCSSKIVFVYGPHWTQLLFFIFDRVGGNFQLSSHWKQVNVLVFFFCFCFAWWHFVIAIICSYNVTILTPINLIYRWKFLKMEAVQIRSDIWPIKWLQNIKWSSGRVEWFPGGGAT